MPSVNFSKHLKNIQPASSDYEPTTGWTRDGDIITYIFKDREVEYEEYLDLVREDETIAPKDRDVMLRETPAPNDL